MAYEAEGGIEMARKRYKPEEIVAKLRQVEVLTARSHPAVVRRNRDLVVRFNQFERNP